MGSCSNSGHGYPTPFHESKNNPIDPNKTTWDKVESTLWLLSIFYKKKSRSIKPV
jgi:hypothetical protein